LPLQVLMLLSALSMVDPGNILDSLKTAKQHRVRVSVVGLAAQVHICETLTQVHFADSFIPVGCDSSAAARLHVISAALPAPRIT